MPQPNGGLGIKDLESFSRALRLRWLWYEWEANEKPWKGMQLPINDDDRSLFNAATIVYLGNGRKASFWNSRWLNGEALAARFPALHKHSKRKNRMVAEALTNNCWIRDIDHSLNQQLIAEYVSLYSDLEGVTLVEAHQDEIAGLSQLMVVTMPNLHTLFSSWARPYLWRQTRHGEHEHRRDANFSSG
jgi:hypothetical protein